MTAMRVSSFSPLSPQLRRVSAPSGAVWSSRRAICSAAPIVHSSMAARPAQVLQMLDAQGPAHGGAQGFAAAQVAHGAHRLGGVRVACQQGGNFGGERFFPRVV